MSGGVDVSRSVAFLRCLFEPQDLFHFRLIESWTEQDTGKAASHVVKEYTKHRLGIAAPNPSTGETIWHYLPDDEIARQLQPLFDIAERERANIYFGVCPRYGGGGKFELAWQIRKINCLWADIDNTNDMAEVAIRCKAASLSPPTIAVSSGNGVHLYWRLAEPYHITDATPNIPPAIEIEWYKKQGKNRKRKWFIDPETGERSIYSVAVKPPLSDQAVLIEDVVSGIASAIGGDSVHDLPRIMRLPGSLNRKGERHGKQPIPCVMVRCEPSCTYSLDDFAQYASKSTSRQKRAAVRVMRLPSKRASIGSGGKSGNREQRTFDDLVNKCAAAELSMRSEADFALCCKAVERGWPKDEVWASATQVGKFAERGEEYFDLTWEKAKLHTQESIYDRMREQQTKQIAEREELADIGPDTPIGDSSKHGPHNEGNADGDSKKLNGKPEVPMFGNDVTLTETAATFGKLLGDTQRYYRRGGVVQRVANDEAKNPTLQIIKPASLPCDMEGVARLVNVVEIEGGGSFGKPTTCSEGDARLILSSAAFFDLLPPIRVISPCPVLIEVAGKLVQAHGYNRECGVLAYGPEIKIPTIEEAKRLLNMLTVQFKYVSEQDRARHLASIITPALIFGGILDGRAPMDLAEADAPQTGKGYKHKLTAAVYNQKVATVKQQKGIGTLEEEFGFAIASGCGFISFDNMRGKIDLTALENYLTEDIYSIRLPFSKPMHIHDSSAIVMFTSNAAILTPDLAERASSVRLTRQDDVEFSKFPEGDLLSHVRENWPTFLGAVFAVVQAWYDAGKPQNAGVDHKFGCWARSLDWMSKNLLDAGPIMDDHRETQQRMANPVLSWLRDVSMEVKSAGKLGEWLRTHHIVDLLIDSDVEVPGMKPEFNMENDDHAGVVYRGVGRKLGRGFGSRNSIRVDRFHIQRDEQVDDSFRPKKSYRFDFLAGSEPVPIRPPENEDGEPHAGTSAPGLSESTAECDCFGPPEWIDSTESDGITRRFCANCNVFWGIVPAGENAGQPDPIRDDDMLF